MQTKKYRIEEFNNRELFEAAAHQSKSLIDIRMPAGEVPDDSISGKIRYPHYPFRYILWISALMALLALLFQIWATTVSYPLFFSGKNPSSWILYIPFAFELFVFFAVVAAAIVAYSRMYMFRFDFNENKYYVISKEIQE